MSDSRTTRVVLISAIVAVLVAGLLTAIGIVGFTSTASANEKLYLEAVEDVGSNPFAPATGTKNPVSRPGAEPGVSVDSVACDPAALVATLEADISLATAWTDALNSDPTLTWSGGNKVRPDQVRAYIAELTPQVLSKDVRVTNYQYTRGAPTSVQSVLQTGSSVMVDHVGVVRVRCKCGNPLTPMKRLTAKPVYEGKPWVGFVDIDIIVVKKCDDDEYWDGDECRLIDCKDGYYYDGGACRPIECDDDEVLRDGYCRPVKCDEDDEKYYEGRGCRPVECKDGENFDGHRCRPPECPKGEYPAGRDCQKPECDDGETWQDGKGCVEPECPSDRPVFTGSTCEKDPCADGAQNTSDCTPPCEANYTWSADKRMCVEAEQTDLPECTDGSTDPVCVDLTERQKAGTAQAATVGSGTTPPTGGTGQTEGTGNPPTGTGQTEGTGNPPTGTGQTEGTGNPPTGTGQTEGTGNPPTGTGQTEGTGNPTTTGGGPTPTSPGKSAPPPPRCPAIPALALTDPRCPTATSGTGKSAGQGTGTPQTGGGTQGGTGGQSGTASQGGGETTESGGEDESSGEGQDDEG